MKALFLFVVVIMSVTVSAVYSLTLLDNLVHGTLYNYGLQFSYDWATPYWTILRTIQALIGLSAVFTLTFTIYVYRKYVYAKPKIEPIAREEEFSSSTTEPEIKPQIVCEEQFSTTAESPTKPNVGEESVSVSATEPEIKPIVLEEPVSSSATEPEIEPQIVLEEPVSPPATEPQPRSVSGLVKCAHCGETFSQPLRRLDFSADKPRIVNVCPACNWEIKLEVSRGELERVEKAVQKKKRKRRAKVVQESKEAIQEQPKDETKETVTVQAC